MVNNEVIKTTIGHLNFRCSLVHPQQHHALVGYESQEGMYVECWRFLVSYYYVRHTECGRLVATEWMVRRRFTGLAGDLAV